MKPRGVFACLFVLALALGPLACRPELVVRLATRVYHDGSVERRVDARGQPADPEEEITRNWLAGTVGLGLAAPGRWDRVAVADDRLSASGFFARVEDLPPTFSFVTDDGARAERSDTELRVEERVVLRRFIYRETHGDPFGPEDFERALDALIDLALDVIGDEVARELGADRDMAAVERWARADARSLLAALLRGGRGPAEPAQRRELWTGILARHGAPLAPPGDPAAFWEAEIPLLLAWSRERVAAALSTPEQTVAGDDLAFWPLGVEDPSGLEELAERHFGGIEGLVARIEPHVSALGGYFGDAASPRFRFEVKVELPGRLLRTNGTPLGDGALWLVRAEDLAAGDAVLEAESAETLADPLTRLGARRELEPEQLLELADLLFRRDSDGALGELLAEAVRDGSLAPLRDPARVPDEVEHLARELADLLDPDAAVAPPL